MANLARLSPSLRFLIADVRRGWHSRPVKWMTALIWATPVWAVAVGAAAASIFFTNLAAEVGTVEAQERLLIFTFVTLPLIAFVIKATSDDVVRFRAAFLSKDAAERDR